MLISPKYKFIFFKPMKVAGSAIEGTMFDYCSENALCTGSTSKGVWEYKGRNNTFNDGQGEGLRFHSHCSPGNFKEKIKIKGIR